MCLIFSFSCGFLITNTGTVAERITFSAFEPINSSLAPEAPLEPINTRSILNFFTISPTASGSGEVSTKSMISTPVSNSLCNSAKRCLVRLRKYIASGTDTWLSVIKRSGNSMACSKYILDLCCLAKPMATCKEAIDFSEKSVVTKMFFIRLYFLVINFVVKVRLIFITSKFFLIYFFLFF